MSGQFSIDESKRVLIVIAKSAGVFEKVAKDNGGLVGKLALFLPMLEDVQSLFKIDLDLFKKEIGELDLDDRMKLIEAFKEHFDLADDKLEIKIEEAMIILSELFDLVEKILAFAKGAK